ncbi:MAG: HAD hydrolase-like protein [Bryobacterales bacterium]|nr:HAD hydrolase-like protein [Bryobacterales bacterium]MDE0294071.1 HAD hydrolase-like protein [Bryobacterales bacterium]
MPALNTLEEFQRKHDFFVALDSDGCVFDSMEIKHKECFTPAFIKTWNLQAAAKYARQVWEFANLYSVDRGMNRFPVLIKSLDLLNDYPEAMRRGIEIPDLQPLRDFVTSGLPPSNASLERVLQEKTDPVLARTMAWSLAVNTAIADMVSGVPPFPNVVECLDRITAAADLAVVSGTPGEALRREWDEHRIDHYPAIIAGQELGKKTEHLSVLTAGKGYANDRMLMIGDAPGDLKAARATGVLFYPVNPGHEEDSWKRLRDEALDRFFAGSYGGDYEAARIAEFEKLLPEMPPWKH